MHNLFLVYFVNLYMFQEYLGPSSGGTNVCIQALVLIILFRWLSVVLVELESNPTRNILRTSCASSWFFFTRLYRDARSTEHKIWLRTLTTKVSELLGCYVLLAGLKSPKFLRSAVPLYSESSSMTQDDLSLTSWVGSKKKSDLHLDWFKLKRKHV